jgi:hypothetical protein
LGIEPLDPASTFTRRLRTQLDRSSDRYSSYVAYRTQVLNGLSVELGGRWDRYSYETGQHLDRLSPRFNVVYSLGRSELRAAWGRIHQPHGVDQLQIEDGVTDTFAPEQVTYSVLSYSTSLTAGIGLQFDAYHKEYEDLRDRFENQFDPLRLVPEAEADRGRIEASEARARGIEVTLRRPTLNQWGGWLGLNYAEAEDYVDGRWQTRSWDQRSTVTFGLGRAGQSWDFHLSGLYHSGVPTTPVYLERQTDASGAPSWTVREGMYNSDRLDRYLRLDMRVSRKSVRRNGTLTYYIEVFNLLDRKNPCCVDRFAVSRNGLARDEEYFFP